MILSSDGIPKGKFVDLPLLGWEIIGDFQVAFHLCFKASPSVKPFIWKDLH